MLPPGSFIPLLTNLLKLVDPHHVIFSQSPLLRNRIKYAYYVNMSKTVCSAWVSEILSWRGRWLPLQYSDGRRNLAASLWPRRKMVEHGILALWFWQIQNAILCKKNSLYSALGFQTRVCDWQMCIRDRDVFALRFLMFQRYKMLFWRLLKIVMLRPLFGLDQRHRLDTAKNSPRLICLPGTPQIP